MSEVQTQSELQDAIQVFTREDGTLPFWDNPNFVAVLEFPDNYRPLTRYEQALEERTRHILTDAQIRLLVVVGAAGCLNEAQLRKYMQPIQSASATSKMVKNLRVKGYLHRFKASIRFQDMENGRKPPGILVLGTVGYKFLNYIYNENTYFNPDKWPDDSDAIQRYVSLNEIRMLATTNRQISDWRWSPAIGGMVKNQKPVAIMSTKTIEGSEQVHFIIERVQMSKTFLDHLKRRLITYGELMRRDGFILVEGIKPPVMQAVIISVSTVSIAEFIQKQMDLHKYGFDILFLVDEWIEETGELATAFAQGTEAGITRLQIPYF